MNCKTTDFRVYNDKYYINLKELKKSLRKCVAGTSKEANKLIQYLVEEGLAEIRRDTTNGKDYINVDKEYITAHEVF